MGQVVNVSLQSLDLSDIILLLLLKLSDGKHRATCIFFHIEALLVELVVLILQLLKGLLVSFRLSTSIPVILEHILLLNLKSPNTLGCHAFLFRQVFSLSLQELVSLSRLHELGIYKLVLTCQCLNVLSELSTLLCLHLYDLRGSFNLLPKLGVVLSKLLELIFSIEQAPLEIVLLTRDNTNLVLHIAVFEDLLF